MQKRFFWGDYTSDKRFVHVVNWSKIELPKELGGLCVSNIMQKNLILLVKIVPYEIFFNVYIGFKETKYSQRLLVV